MRKIPFHPFLLALFPLLSLFARNADYLGFAGLPLLIVVVLVGAGLAFLGAIWLFRDKTRAAIIASIFLTLWFSYGHVLTGLVLLFRDLNLSADLVSSIETTPVRLLILGLCIVLFVLGCLLVSRYSGNIGIFNEFFNYFALATMLVVGLNIWQAVQVDPRVSSFISTWNSSAQSPQPIAASFRPATTRPDIYYIVLDGYGRSDVLQNIYNLDNSAFYSYLKGKGFYIADNSRSNYMQTALSLASSLNSMYLDDLVNRIGDDAATTKPLATMIQNNRLFPELRHVGYKIAAFSTGFPPSEMTDADLYMRPPIDLTAFDNVFINTTPLPLLLELPLFKNQYDFHRDRILYTLDHISSTGRVGSPRFVFAHVLAPHPPFVFGANGESVQADRTFESFDGSTFTAVSGEQEYWTSYRNQVEFISRRVEQTIDRILAQSTTPPIIIVQGDHGPGSMLDWTSSKNTNLTERLSILNAFYFPDGDYKALYPGITPVNTFRIVLGQYVNPKAFSLLPDESFYSTGSRIYDFENVAGELRDR